VPRFPEDARAWLARRYRNQHREWLSGGGTWPLAVGLESPRESEAMRLGEAVRDWVEAWRAIRAPGQVEWRERRWRSLGAQMAPERLLLRDAAEVAAWVGEEVRWARACARHHRLGKRWPAMLARLPRYFEALADWPDGDVARLEGLLAWLEANPESGLYARQIPLAGMDTKWLEPRLPVIADLLGGGLRLREAPRVLRVRLLDPALRARVGGLSDIVAPVEEIAALDLPASRVYIVENVQTGLCFGDRAGSVVFLGLGYGVNSLERVAWASGAEAVYWGDLDTHGFAILNRARAVVPGLRSVLMDEATLLAHRDLWGEEAEQCGWELPLLTAAEQEIYQGLRRQCWGRNVRLEQERIRWDDAWISLRE
jgi:hypothetical protein